MGFSKLVIHHEPAIAWHKQAHQFRAGLKKIGIEAELTTSRERISDKAILFGTSLFREIEKSGDWLLVDRASYGDPDFVQLVWNGHGRRGDHKVPEIYGSARWESHGVEMLPQRQTFTHHVLCGQTETYSPDWNNLSDWYDSKKYATHFRPHPQGAVNIGLPIKMDFDDSMAIVLNSSVAVDCVLKGIPTAVHDEGSMCWGLWESSREEWAHWLAFTQWTWEEIAEGAPIAHLFDV